MGSANRVGWESPPRLGVHLAGRKTGFAGKGKAAAARENCNWLRKFCVGGGPPILGKSPA